MTNAAPKHFSKTVLIVGAGGREHALAHKLSESAHVSKLLLATGPTQNKFWGHGLSTDIKKPLTQITAPLNAPFKELLAALEPHKPDLCVIGPDNPLADGIADVLREAGYRVFGPSKKAAQIESSKGFAKALMKKAGIPTAKSTWVETATQALDFLKTLPESTWLSGGGSGWVIKADGLALGKGVHVCETLASALLAVESLRPLAQSYLIEERLHGEEVSWIALCDGQDFVLMDSVRDHKRLLDGDQGPNTGGMGVFSPVPGLPLHFREQMKTQVFAPMLKVMRDEGIPFCGALFAGVMLDQASRRFWVLEFNARFGDPETQVLLPRLQEDLFEWLDACAVGTLAKQPQELRFIKDAGVFVVAAAKGYPEHPQKGQRIQIEKNKLEFGTLYFAGVSGGAAAEAVSQSLGSAPLFTGGGRVLGALGLGANLEQARTRAYKNLNAVSFDGQQSRQDIALAPAIAIMGSGRGSNFDALARAIQEGRLHARIVGVIADRSAEKGAQILHKAEALGIPTAVCPVVKGSAFGDEQAAKTIQAWGARFVVLAGYMKLLSPSFLKAFQSPQSNYSRVINVHPSLLPAFPGAHSYQAAFEHGCKVTGVTLHLVDPEMDSGPILAQRAFEISGCESVAEVESLGLVIEHQLYPETLNWVLKEQFKIRQSGTDPLPGNSNGKKERLRVHTS